MLCQGARGFIEGYGIAAVHLDRFGPSTTRPFDQAPAPLSPRVRDGPAVLLHVHKDRELMNGRRTLEDVEVVVCHAAITAVYGHDLAGLLTLVSEDQAIVIGDQSMV